ncbi:hypothetical protein UFOVP1320_7 [uncultured Caudovirales phage]|uniref:Uncharacterized protein n=1 Tax=uncultured Caudovirales phage TaxID=2100421 RepID=A0A6J7X9T6_9CAUD|nr:hypothetical protein UFOVP548_22 [uncultured Caudovirales phage]CAB4169954.1 hypothetical protein UFOVP904_22 [uncultured Caudovirales phage]CAB4182349.1 hypothetical protein UFOVP1079_3 [uncultured Caudovirales phage]CAB4197333.1 hypothetical protein UFOVP1320_7 [uncultured Caudovirales phage]CAB4211828.1 hypothetical protein UFOVP1431_48 [uncultured Caudovirales phage]
MSLSCPTNMTAPADNTPASIIEDAYFDAGLTQEGQSPNSEQITTGMRKLTDLINLWQTDGLKLWLNFDLSVTLTAGVGTYTIGPAGTIVQSKPTRVVDCYYLDQNGIRRPLNVLSWNEYVRLSQINQQGAVNSYFVNKEATVLSIFFWLLPDSTAATGTCHPIIQQQVTNFTGVTDTMNFPIEWRIALRWGLADEICTGQPQAIMDRCSQRAGVYKAKLDDWDVEDAPTRFSPDARSQYSTGRFR